MYVVSVIKDNKYEPHSVYSDFKSIKLALMDIIVNNDELFEELKHYSDSLHIEDSIYMFKKSIKIDKIENRLTSEIALKNIKHHITKRFIDLSLTSKKICFPKEIIDSNCKEFWFKLDKHNYKNVIKHLEHFIENKIEELKTNNIVRYGILAETTEEFVSVKFTNSYTYRHCQSNFCITISPDTGYTTSLN